MPLIETAGHSSTKSQAMRTIIILMSLSHTSLLHTPHHVHLYHLPAPLTTVAFHHDTMTNTVYRTTGTYRGL